MTKANNSKRLDKFGQASPEAPSSPGNSPPYLATSRAKRLARLQVEGTAGLDSSNSWRYAGRLNTMSDVGNLSRRALARHRQLKEALHRTLDDERVDTPRFAARRDLPPSAGLPEAPPPEESLHTALKYWAPSTASKRCPSYLFHEPGIKVRESLAILEEMRWPGGRARLSSRHAAEVQRAQQTWDIEAEKKTADDAASKVQRFYRSGRHGAGNEDSNEDNNELSNELSNEYPSSL